MGGSSYELNHQSSCVLRRGLRFKPAAPARGTGGQYPLPLRREARGGATRCVTPRQTCPRPNGFGRNLRSKTRWFTGFCNSHQVSHLATFFIDARAEISVVESRFVFSFTEERHRRRRPRPRTGRRRDGSLPRSSLRIPWRGSRRGSLGAVERGSSPIEIPPEGRTCSSEGQNTRSRVVLLRGQVSTMILPQVHLRKPCYDFSFL